MAGYCFLPAKSQRLIAKKLVFYLLVAVDDAAAVEIVRAELNRDTVAGEDADEVFAHTSGDVRKCLMLVFKLDLEHGVWQRLDDGCHYLNCIFLRQTLSFGGVGLNSNSP